MTFLVMASGGLINFQIKYAAKYCKYSLSITSTEMPIARVLGTLSRSYAGREEEWMTK